MQDNHSKNVDSTSNEVPNDKTAPNTKSKTHKHRADKHIWGIYIALCIISIVELYSASSREIAYSTTMGVYEPIVRHISTLLLGFVVILVMQRIHFKHYFKLSRTFVVLSVIMMVYVLINGDIINGARRSFTLFGFMVQPSEFLKLSAVLLIAYVMSQYQINKGISTKGVVICGISIIVFCGLLFNQGLTNTILLLAVSMSMMFVGGVELKKFFLMILCYIVAGAGAFAYKYMASENETEAVEATTTTVQIAGENGPKEIEIKSADKGEKEAGGRFETWIKRIERYANDSIPKYKHPITAENRQEMYSYMAQANGGLFGVFPGNSRETARLPLANIDYIYAIIIEDMGYIGGMFVLFLYMWLLARAGAIATRCRGAFPALLVMGPAVMISFQALFHMAIVTGVFPVSGQPLPLISKGGSSIIITSIAFGLMLSVSKHAVRTSGKKKDFKAEIEQLPEGARGDNPIQI